MLLITYEISGLQTNQLTDKDICGKVIELLPNVPKNANMDGKAMSPCYTEHGYTLTNNKRNAITGKHLK